MEDSTQIQAPDTADLNLLSPFVIHLAPPFNGWTGIRSPTPNGYWTAVRTNGSSGEIVMQLGRRHSGLARYTRGYLTVGWKRSVWVRGGTRFRTVFAAGPISLRPNGGYVDASIQLELRRSDGRTFSASARPVSHRTTTLEVEVPTSGDYVLQVTGNLSSFYWGYANPYGEMIGRFTAVQQLVYRPFEMEQDVDPDVPQPFAPLQMTAGDGPQDDALAATDAEAFEASEALLERQESDDPQELAEQGQTVFKE